MYQDDEGKLRGLNQLSFEAEDKRDSAALAPILADEFRIVRSSFKVETKPEMLTSVANSPPGRRRTVSEESVRVHGHRALVASLITLEEGETFIGRFWNTKIFAKQGEEWRCVAWQVAEIERAP